MLMFRNGHRFSEPSRPRIAAAYRHNLFALAVYVNMIASYITAISAVAINWDSQSVFTGFLSSKESHNDLHSDLLTIGHSRTTLISPQQFDSWVETHYETSFEQLMDNVAHPNNQILDSVVVRGGAIASPSKSAPDYFYLWTRDSAITINTIVHKWSENDRFSNDTLEQTISDYIDLSYKLQRTWNPSGGFNDDQLRGLGEPKFEVNGAPFMPSWGRPQRDGPALRAITLMNYLTLKNNTLFGDNDVQKLTQKNTDFTAYVDRVFSKIISYDLDYVNMYWNQSGFDLWEEVDGIHFFTTMVQHRALKVGSRYALAVGDRERHNAYKETAALIKDKLNKSFYDSDKHHVMEHLDYPPRSGLDCGTVLAALYAFNSNDIDDADSVYQPYDDRILATIHEIVWDMKRRYPINQIRMTNFANLEGADDVNLDLVGVGVGRYPEDVYNGVGTSQGNPWFLCTASISETMYILARYLETRADDYVFQINDISKEFYRPFLGDKVDHSGFRIHKNEDSEQYQALVQQIIDYGDSFLDVVREHEDQEGNLSEQFNRVTGFMEGATKLTWSFGQFWRAIRQRKIAVRLFQDANM